MNSTITQQLQYIYCHHHRDLIGKVMRKISSLVLQLLNENYFEQKLISRIKKIVHRTGKVDSRIKYFYYLLCIKRYEANYIKFLSKNQMYQATKEKEDWANFICNYSECEYEIKAAEDYLFLMIKYGISDDNKNYSSLNIFPSKTKRTENTFYLFGPNSDHEPSTKYLDSTIILSKDVNFDISQFKDSIMYLNYVYYQTKVKNDPEKHQMMIKKYGKVFVSSLYPIDDTDFSLSVMPLCSALGGAQGLGRALFNLITKYGRISCIVEGYDFWLNKETFSNYYPTLNRIDNNIDEKRIVTGLADHDAVYNFLFVKEMLNYVTIIDSYKFLEYINMPVDQYIKKLVAQRGFELLSK